MTKFILIFAISASIYLPTAGAQQDSSNSNPSKIEGTKADDGQPDKTLLKEPIQNTSAAELNKKKHRHVNDPSKKMSKPNTEIKVED